MKSKQLELIVCKVIEVVVKNQLPHDKAITKLYNAVKKYSKFHECSIEDKTYVRESMLVLMDLVKLQNRSK